MERKGRKLFSTSKLERKIFKVVFVSAGIPVFVVVAFFYCLFSDLVYTYLNSGMADQFVYQFLILSGIILLYYFLFVAVLAYRFVPRLVGALPRIVQELEETVSGKSKSRIRLRRGDYLKDAVSQINKFMDNFGK